MTKIIFKFYIDQKIKRALQGENYSKAIDRALRDFINHGYYFLKHNIQFESNGYMSITLDRQLYRELQEISRVSGKTMSYIINISLFYYLMHCEVVI